MTTQAIPHRDYLTPFAKLPPFPVGEVNTAPLVTLSLDKLLANDPAESASFFKASKELGFVYLDCRGCDQGETMLSNATALHELQQEFFKLPREELDKYDKRMDPFFAYRPTEISVRNSKGEFERNASYNMRKDDILGNVPRLPAPQLVLDNQPLLESYARTCHGVITALLNHLNDHLQLAPGTLANLHRINEPSGDHIRFTRAAPQPYDERRIAIGEHTDFGSLTILFNWLGGLQVRLPTTNQWVYVRPIPGCAVLNLGDALVKFTAGILRSNIHRVAPPPGLQTGQERNSLVYFSRPENTVVLRRLKGGMVDQQPATPAEEEMTSAEWIMRRSTGDLKGVYKIGGIESPGRTAALDAERAAAVEAEKARMLQAQAPVVTASA